MQALAKALTPDFAFVGLARGGGSRPTARATAGASDKGPDAMFRVASVSKIVTGQVFAELAARRGEPPPYAMPLRDVLHWFPGAATLGQVASHTGGISDAAGYAVPAGEALADFVRARPATTGVRIGAFDYSNLGYILLAAVCETWAGRRFDALAADWLAARDIPGGFNWCGVGDVDVLPTFRRGADGFVPQIDAPPVMPDVPGDYVPGQNPALFSPQGGMRTSLDGMLRLAAALKECNATVLYQGTPFPSDRPLIGDEDAVFESYGAGVQIFDAPAFYPRPLIGHFGNAYGFRGGVWLDRARDCAFAYALNGLEENDESDAFSAAELRIFAAMAQED